MTNASDPKDANGEPPVQGSTGEAPTPEHHDIEPRETTPEERIAALEAEIATLRGDYLRVLADADNTRKMADKRVQENSKYAVSNFAKSLLSVADFLSMALMAAPENRRGEHDLLKALAMGVELTERELQKVLENQGIRRMNSAGQAFDPHRHEAVEEVEDASVAAGTIVRVMQEGYMIADRPLRPARVAVAKGGSRPATPGNGSGEATSGEGVDTRV